MAGQSFLEKMDTNFTLKDLGGHGRPRKDVSKAQRWDRGGDQCGN